MKKRIAALPAGALVVTALLLGLAPSANTAAATLSVGGGAIAALGATATVEITLDEAPNGLSGYIITVALSDCHIATISSVTFPAWATLTDSSGSPGDSVRMKAVDLSNAIKDGATGISLGSLVVQAQAEGECTFTVLVERVEDDDGNTSMPSVVTGVLSVAVPSPSVTVEQEVSQGDPTDALPILFAVTFSEAVVGLEVEDFGFGGTAEVEAASLTGSGGSYTLSIDAASGAGTVIPFLSQGATVDAAGHPSRASTSADNCVTYAGAKLSGALTLAASPMNLVADGRSTATLAVRVLGADGGNASDGTAVLFTTDRGTIEGGGTATWAATKDGVAVATLVAASEVGIATVRAQAGEATTYTAVFFKQPGQPDVVGAVTMPTMPGTSVVDAGDVASAIVSKTGTGTPTITVARYEGSSRGASATFLVEGAICVCLDSLVGVDSITVCVLSRHEADDPKGVVLYWWNPASSMWARTSPQSVTKCTDLPGYATRICTSVLFENSVPTIAQLWFALFAEGGGSE